MTKLTVKTAITRIVRNTNVSKKAMEELLTPNPKTGKAEFSHAALADFYKLSAKPEANPGQLMIYVRYVNKHAAKMVRRTDRLAEEMLEAASSNETKINEQAALIEELKAQLAAAQSATAPEVDMSQYVLKSEANARFDTLIKAIQVEKDKVKRMAKIRKLG